MFLIDRAHKSYNVTCYKYSHPSHSVTKHKDTATVFSKQSTGPICHHPCQIMSRRLVIPKSGMADPFHLYRDPTSCDIPAGTNLTFLVFLTYLVFLRLSVSLFSLASPLFLRRYGSPCEISATLVFLLFLERGAAIPLDCCPNGGGNRLSLNSLQGERAGVS